MSFCEDCVCRDCMRLDTRSEPSVRIVCICDRQVCDVVCGLYTSVFEVSSGAVSICVGAAVG